MLKMSEPLSDASASMGERFSQRLREFFAPGAAAALRYLPTILLLQAGAVGLVVAFYSVPDFRAVCEQFGLWKERGGLLFAALSNVVAGVFVPEAAKWLTGKGDADANVQVWLARVWWLCVMFAGGGVIVDSFYRLQALVFGPGTDFATVALKVAVDQALFTPLVGQPYAVLFFLWLEEGRSVRRWWRRLSWGLLFERVFKLALPGWVYWIPMVCCIYAMPSALQFPLFLLCMACWSLVFIAILRSFTERK